MGRRTNYRDIMVKQRFIEVVEEYNLDVPISPTSQLAAAIGCNKNTLHRYMFEDGRSLHPEIVKKISQETGVSMDWLYGLSDEKYLKGRGHDNDREKKGLQP